jgi:hypothetical protein
MARQIPSGYGISGFQPAVFRLVRAGSEKKAAGAGIGLEPDANAAASVIGLTTVICAGDHSVKK